MANPRDLQLPAPPPGMSRRGFLGLVVAGVAAACSDDGGSASTTSGTGASTTGPSTSLPVPDLPANPFALGVASGDPVADGVVLWTRLAPEPLEGGGMPGDPVPVTWAVYPDGDDDLDGAGEALATGAAVATAALGHSVHVEVDGLDADTWYRYRFQVGEWSSPIGRTRTTPAAGASVESMRFVFASCQHWESGEWAAWTALPADEPDLLLFLGDYIYEYAGDDAEVTPSGRNHNGGEIIELADYRNRYGLYKGDERLQAAHAACPWVMTWDDHEVENDYADDIDENGSPPADFLERRARAYQAFYEHTPIRVAPPEGPDLAIYRSIDWGALASFAVLDTRQYRSDHVCAAEGLGGTVGPPCDAMDDPAHVFLGREQEEWLGGVLRDADATWHVLANQTVFTPLPFATLRNLDQWDGYPKDRQRLLDLLVAEEISNPVVITGDIHASGVGDVHASPEDPTSPIVATELVGTSISSDAGGELEAVVPIARAIPWVRYIETTRRGYVRCDVTDDELRATFRYVVDAFDAGSDVEDGPTWVITAGTPGAREA